MIANSAPLLPALSLALTVSAFAAAPVTHSSARPPNIIVIITDDLGYGDTGVYGGTGIRTPNIDRLAAEGLRFTQAYAPASTCTPSRYGMLTGEYAWRRPAQQTSILDGDAPLAIDPAAVTLPAFLKRSGYATGLIGKWHLGLGDGKTAVDFNGEIKPGPLEIGFDTAFFIPATVDRVPCVFIENHRVHGLDPADPIAISYLKRIGDDPVGHEHPELLRLPADRQHGDTIINGISRIGHMSGGRAARWVDEEIDDIIIRRSVDFIAEHRTRPFFLCVGTHAPHAPRTPAARFRGTSSSGLRGDSIAGIDWGVGEIVAALEKNGLTENTLVIFTSDNGPVLIDGYHDDALAKVGSHRPAGPYRGWKYLRFEGSTRVPFIVRWPGHVTAGRTTDRMFSLVDLLASTAALLDQPLPPGAGRDSLNLLPTLLGQPGGITRDHVVQHGIGNVLALRQGDWKYLPANADTATGIGRGADPRDTRFAEARTPEPLLFNLADDPGETRNVAAEHPEILRQLAARLDEIRHAAP